MKTLKMKLLLGSLIVSSAMTCFAQEKLPEITLTAVRYKYLSAVDNKQMAEPVKFLERKVAEYDVKNSEYYDEDYKDYTISFYIPEGYILASYDKDGRLLSTAEKFKNIAVPAAVAEAVAKRFPEWSIAGDVYRVNYENDKGAKKVWKLLLKNGDKRLKVITNEKGEFIR
jgi:hypothetical protein